MNHFNFLIIFLIKVKTTSSLIIYKKTETGGLTYFLDTKKDEFASITKF